MKHLVYLALAAGALAMTGCDDVAAPPAAAPAPTPATPAPTTPAAEYSCGDGYIFDSDQLPGPEGAVVNDVFYWGSSTSGAARCFSDTRNNSIVGRVESNAGDVATGATVMSVTLSGELRWYLILEFSDGTYCSAATAGDGRPTCFATVERDATGFRVDDLPAVPLPVPEGAPERPVVDPPGGPGPGGGDGGHTGAPEPEEPAEEEPAAPPPATSSLPCPDPLPESYLPPAGREVGWREGETAPGCIRLRLTLDRNGWRGGFDNEEIYPPDHGSGEPSLYPYAYGIWGRFTVDDTIYATFYPFNFIRASISLPDTIITSEGNTFKVSVTGRLKKSVWDVLGIRGWWGNTSSDKLSAVANIHFSCSEPEAQSGECGTDEQGNPLYVHRDAWHSLLRNSTFTVYCRYSATVINPSPRGIASRSPVVGNIDCR